MKMRGTVWLANLYISEDISLFKLISDSITVSLANPLLVSF